VPDNRVTLIRRAGLLATGFAALLGVGALRWGSTVASSVPSVAAMPDSLAFDVDYAGLGAEGVDLIWRGRVAGSISGSAVIRVEYAGAPADRRRPLWPVNAWLFFSADDYRHSFAAELSGSMDWRTGELQVTGLVSDGIRRDSPIEQSMRLRPPGLAGRLTVRFIPRLAARSAPAGNS
jgi:hypothetical protein